MDEHTLEAAQLVKKSFDDAQLRIIEPKLHDGVPSAVALDVAAQISFLQKLKFQYLEQNAKDKYIKSIVSDIDDAPLITHASNELVRSANEGKKQRLKSAKCALDEKARDVRRLAPLVEQDYLKAKTVTDEAASLSQRILDARLSLTRLRSSHPHPRLTVAAATETLDKQIAEMQVLDDELQALNERVGGAKDGVGERKREVERVRVERAEVERDARDAGGEEEEEGVVGLYEWFTSSLSLHRSMLSLDSSHAPSENELRLTYLLRGETEVKMTLLFVPNTRQLATARVEVGEGELEVGELVEVCVERNDVAGFVAAVLARCGK